MSNAERKLAQAFAADQPPASDRAFGFSVLERIDRRRAFAEALDGIPLALAAGALLWLLAPTIDRLVQSGVALIDTPSFVMTAVILLSVLAFSLVPSASAQ